MSVQVSVKKQFVMGIVIILMFLAVVEGIVRGWEYFALGCNPSESDAYEDMNYFLVRQICLDVRFLQFTEPDVVSNKSDQHLGTINTNSYGIRGPEFPIDKPDNTYRIIIVGGSTTFGHGASSDDTTIPAFIQKKFNEQNMPMNIHVINAGVNSLYSFTEVYHIKNKLMKFDADLIINYGGANDADLYIPEPKIKSAQEFEEEESSFKFRNFPQYRTPFAIFSIFFAEQYKEENFAEKINPTENVVPAWKNRWMDLCRDLNDKDVKIALFVQPGLGTGNKELTAGEKHFVDGWAEHQFTTLKNLAGFAEALPELSKHCDYVSDVRDIFDNYSIPIYWDQFHMTDGGNKIVADRLFEEIYPLVIQDMKN